MRESSFASACTLCTLAVASRETQGGSPSTALYDMRSTGERIWKRTLHGWMDEMSNDFTLTSHIGSLVLFFLSSQSFTHGTDIAHISFSLLRPHRRCWTFDGR